MHYEIYTTVWYPHLFIVKPRSHYATSSLVYRMTSDDLVKLEKQTPDAMSDALNMSSFDLRLVPSHLI